MSFVPSYVQRPRLGTFLLLSLMLTACGGGGDAGRSSVTQVESTQSRNNENFFTLRAAGVKGPLAYANVRVFELDTNFPRYYDPARAIASGETNGAAQLPPLNIPGNYTPPFVLVFNAENAVDLNSGKRPVLTSLSTIVTADMLASGKTVYATPLTSLAHRITETVAGPGISASEVTAHLDSAAKKITSTLGLGLPRTVDILRDPPLLTEYANSAGDQQIVAHHRAALEALAAVTSEIAHIASVDAETILDEIAMDLGSDGVIDQTANGQTLQHIDLAVLQKDPKELLVPGTNLRIAEVGLLLSNDLAVGATTVAVSDPDMALAIQQTQLSSDTDGDGIPNIEDTVANQNDSTRDSQRDKSQIIPTVSPISSNTTITSTTSATGSSTTRSVSSTSRSTASTSTTTTSTLLPALNRREWSLYYVDSQEAAGENGTALNAIDGDPGTIWHTGWSVRESQLPHEIQIDSGTVARINGIRYLPRQDSRTNGRIKDFQVYVSDDGQSWGSAVAAGTLENSYAEQTIVFAPVLGRFVRLVALSEVTGKPFTSAAEITLLGTPLPGNRSPAAKIDSPSADINIGLGEMITFAASGHDVDGDALTYSWNFGTSGVPSVTGATPDPISFSVPGTYLVTLNIVDSAGNVDATPPKRKVTVIDNRIPRDHWSVMYVDSEETGRQDGRITNILDGNINSIWHTAYSSAPAPAPPHEFQLNLGARYEIQGFRYVPRQDKSTNGSVKVYDLYISDDGKTWNAAVHGSFSADKTIKSVNLTTATIGRFVRFVAHSSHAGEAFTSMAEFDLIGTIYAVNSPPVAAITAPAKSLNILQGESVVFSGGASDIDGDALTYRWTFGDSSIGDRTMQNPGAITFRAPGIHTVSFYATDSQGNTVVDPPRVIITVNAAPAVTTTTRSTSTTSKAPTTTTSRASTTTTTRPTTTTTRASTTTTTRTTTTSRATTTTTTTRATSTTTSTRASSTTTSTTTTTLANGTSDDPLDWTDVLGNTTGNIFFVASESEFNATAAIAQPGDAVIIRDGTYRWGNLRISSRGTKERPIVYTAQTPGGVTFENVAALFEITGRYNIIGGFKIRGITQRVFYFTGAAGARTTGATDNRVTDNEISESGSPNVDAACPCWMIEFDARSHRNRLDHNRFDRNYGYTRVRIAEDAVANGPSQDVRIDHNSFSNTLGTEVPVFQIGACAECYPGAELLDVRAVFENNEVYNHRTGYGEIVSNKSSGNIIRYNSFHSSYGGIMLRMGNHVQVYGNFLDGGSSTGIEISGAYHRIYNNIIAAPKKPYGIVMWRSGERPSTVRGAPLPPTHHNVIANNTILGYSKQGMRINECNLEACEPITNSIIANNILVGSVGTLFQFNPGGATNVVITNNLYYKSGTASYGAGYSNDVQPFTADPSITSALTAPVTSAVVNKGVSLDTYGYEPVTVDHLGRPRIGIPDLGAIERQ